MVLVTSGVLPGAEVYQARLPLAPTTLLVRTQGFDQCQIQLRPADCACGGVAQTGSWYYL